MVKTISANLSQDELMQIDQYCKDNNISKNDLIKGSVKDRINAKQNKSLEDTPVDPKTIETSFIKKLVAEIDKENELRKKIEPELKEAHDTGIKKGQDNMMDHWINKNCPKGSCEICNLKYAIQDKQRSKDVEEFQPTLQNTASNSYCQGVQDVITTMNENPDKNTNEVHAHVLKNILPRRY